LVIGITAVLLWDNEPTCSDNTQNQGEKGVDCGGPCDVLCQSQVTDLNILWSRSFKVVDGIYNAVAYIENPNFEGGIKSLPYTFKLRDKENIIVAERLGNVFVPPGEVVAVFEPSIKTGKRVSHLTTFSIDEERHMWEKMESYENPLKVMNIKRKLYGSSPKLEAEIKNTSIEEVSDISVTVTIFNKENNAIGVSETYVSSLAGGNSTSIVFTWPRSFQEEISKVDIKTQIPFSKG